MFQRKRFLPLIIVGGALLATQATAQPSELDPTYSYNEYMRFWMKEDAGSVATKRGCRHGVNPKNGRSWDEIDRCGQVYEIATDEQIVLAQLNRANTFKRMAEERCAKGSPHCATFRKQAEAVEHTTIVQIAAYVSGDGDGTVELADDGTVKLKVSKADFATPATKRLAAMNHDERRRVANVAGPLNAVLHRYIKDLKIRFLGEDEAI